MKYEKYAGGYRVSGTLPNGVRLRKSLKGLNRAQAKDYVRRLTDEATVEVVTGKKPRAPTTFAQAAEAWLRVWQVSERDREGDYRSGRHGSE